MCAALLRSFKEQHCKKCLVWGVNEVSETHRQAKGHFDQTQQDQDHTNTLISAVHSRNEVNSKKLTNGYEELKYEADAFFVKTMTRVNKKIMCSNTLLSIEMHCVCVSNTTPLLCV